MSTLLSTADFAPPATQVGVATRSVRLCGMSEPQEARTPPGPRLKNARYSETTISRAKALLAAGMKASSVARLIAAPYNTVRDWSWGKRCAEVQPDPGVLRYIDKLFVTKKGDADA